MGVVLSFCINQTAFIGVDHANKKGGYLLSRIALFDKVYHWTNWGVEGKQKKRPFDCSNERFDKKKGGYLLSRIALLIRQNEMCRFYKTKCDFFVQNEMC